MPDEETTPWTVSDVCKATAGSLKKIGGNLLVAGEVTHVNKATSGHLYFDIKDETACLKCIQWRSRVKAVPVQGRVVTLRGYLEFYAQKGSVSFVATEVLDAQDAALGAQARAREAFLEALQTEGVLDRPRRALPDIPKHVCIVTALGSAALADMREGIEQRWKDLRVTVVHASVQGAQAPEELVRALARATELGADVLVLARGGGSVEDLAAFDDPRVVRALAACEQACTVSAVGHETDHSLCDAVCDLRAKTPTAAIEVVVPEARALRDALARANEDLTHLARHTIDRARTARGQARTNLDAAVTRALGAARTRLGDARTRLATAPQRGIAEAQGKTRTLHTRLHAETKRRLTHDRDRLTRARDGLRGRVRQALDRHAAVLARTRAVHASLDPKLALARGYALVRDAHEGTVVTTRAAVEGRRDLRLVFSDGDVTVTVG